MRRANVHQSASQVQGDLSCHVRCTGSVRATAGCNRAYGVVKVAANVDAAGGRLHSLVAKGKVMCLQYEHVDSVSMVWRACGDTAMLSQACLP